MSLERYLCVENEFQNSIGASASLTVKNIENPRWPPILEIGQVDMENNVLHA
jgi:hypothetical protein